MPASAVEALRRHRADQLLEKDAQQESWQDHDFAFFTMYGAPLDSANARLHLHRLLDRAGLPRQRFHDLRHAAASLLLAGKVDINTVSEMLGHLQIGITANLYAHLAPVLKRDAADTMDAILAAAAQGRRNSRRQNSEAAGEGSP